MIPAATPAATRSKIVRGSMEIRNPVGGSSYCVSRAQRNTKWCAADPGSFQVHTMERSRICGAPQARCAASGTRDLEKRLDPRLCAAEDERVDVVGAFVGVHRLEVREHAHHVIFLADAVAAVHVA